MSQHPAGFLSYVRSDDEHLGGRISSLRERLQGEIRFQTGDKSFSIFQDLDDIAWGEPWRRRINESLDAVTFLIPIITPSFFKSKPCRDELERFLEREKQLNRDDLILPIYFHDCPEMSSGSDPLASVITARQYADWRKHRFEAIDSSEYQKLIADLAAQVLVALRRGETTSVPGATSGDAMAGLGGQPADIGESKFADERLNTPIDFGSTLSEIAAGFKVRMDEFNAIDGAGPDKYLDLGAHVYSCVASALDRWSARPDTNPEHRRVIDGMSSRLKELADYGTDYLKNNSFPKFWADGAQICDELLAQVRQMEGKW